MLFRSLLSLPAKMAMQVAGEQDVNAVIQTLTKGFREALDELSEYDPDRIDGDGAEGIDAEDEEDEA